MVARRLRLNNESKSSVLRLIDYLMNDQGVNCRVAGVNIENCESDDPQWAALEMLGVQKQNSRAQADKVYHLVLSFHEYPPEKVLRQIEEEFCKELGFKGHQRISVFHNDTDNPHLHVVINKINPKKLTMHEPYYDHQKLASVCDRMERLHGLVQDNHIPKAQAAETGAKNMEGAGDLESLIGKIQRTCLDDMKQAESWKEIHTILCQQGFEMRIRANGLIISSGDIHVKASSIDRSFSKKRLEERLGPFEASQENSNTQQYTVQPLKHFAFDSSALWREYGLWVEENDRQRKAALQQAQQERDAALKKVRVVSGFRAALIRNFVSGIVFKRILYSHNMHRLKRKRAAIKAQYNVRRAELYHSYKHVGWNTWLTHEAAQGNDEALAALRSRKSSDRVVTPSFSAAFTNSQRKPTQKPVKATGQGTLIFAEGAKLTANHVRLAPDASDSTIKECLEVAAQCFGQDLKVDGSRAFKERVVKIAATHGLSVRFADTYMEKQRLILLTQKQASEQQRRSR